MAARFVPVTGMPMTAPVALGTNRVAVVAAPVAVRKVGAATTVPTTEVPAARPEPLIVWPSAREVAVADETGRK